MSTVELRRLAKRSIDALPPEQLRSVVDFIGYVSSAPAKSPRPAFAVRMAQAKADADAGRLAQVTKLRRKG